MNLLQLVNKLNEGTITPGELKELHEILKQNDNSLIEIMDEEWKKGSGKAVEFDSLQQFQKLENRLNIKSRFYKQSITLISLIKYAAVLIMGFLLAWVVISNKPEYFNNEPAQNEYTTVKVANGSKSIIDLPDGSTVHLNSGSQISYPQKFGKDYRTVILKGEGYFEVKENHKIPFYVETEQIIIKVLGTSFNVKSYPDEDITETALITGKVEIYQNNKDKLPDKSAHRLAVLNPSEIAIISKNEIKVSKTGEENKAEIVDKSVQPEVIVEKSQVPESYSEWRNDILVFNNEQFNGIVKKLERWYNVAIELKYEQLSPIRFSGKFDRESIEDVLNALKLIESFDFEINKNKIIIFKENT